MKRPGLFLAGLAFLFCVGNAQAQPGVLEGPNAYDKVLQRLLEAEARIRELESKLDKTTSGGPATTPTGLGSPEVDAAIQEIVAQHLKAKEEKKKAAEAKKEPEWYHVGTDLNLKPTVNKGHLYFTTPNKDFSFELDGRLHMDAGWFDADPALPVFEDGTSVRRARIGIQGRFWENIFWRTAYDFGEAVAGEPFTNFRDAYIRVEKLPIMGNLQIGQMKEPLSLSWSSTSNQLLFLERPLPVNAFIPDRNTGVQVFRNFGADDRIFASTSIWFQQGNAGAFSNGDGQYAWTSRVAALPWYTADGRCLLHVGGGYSRRSWSATDGPRFRDFAEARIGTTRLLDTGVIVGANEHNLHNGEAALVLGPLSFQSEIMAVDFERANGDRVNYWGTYAMVSYFLTGENRKYSKSVAGFTTIDPYENFFYLREGGHTVRGIGAWEICARWSYLDLRDAGFVVPTAANRGGGTGTLNDVTFGVNWYLNPQTTLQFNYIHGFRDSDIVNRDGSVDTLAMRLRFWF